LAAAAIPILLGISAAGAGVEAISALTSPSSPKAPTAEQTQTEQAKAAQAAAQAQATALSRRRGMASTILTSPLGIQGSTSTQSATLGA
jgi:hypothetical protein